MKAITVIEAEDGSVTVTGNVVNGDIREAVELLHRGIKAICVPALTQEAVRDDG